MAEEMTVTCSRCGSVNKVKMGRVYPLFRCPQCETAVDLDDTLTIDLVPPVKMVRDTVTVGYRSRDLQDWIPCEVCGEPADLLAEDVLEKGRQFKCRSCGHITGESDSGS
jgi:DNA-directed RNA polymerase subunit RPC12/RpoP